MNNTVDMESALKDSEAELKRSKDLLALLSETSKAITSEVELEKVVQMITDKATQLSGAEFGAFFYNTTQEEEKLMLYVLSGASKESFSKFPHPRATAIFKPTFDGTRTVRFDNVRESPLFGNNPPYNGMPANHLPVTSYLAVPVISPINGEVIGGIFLAHSKPGIFKEKEEKLVEGIALQGAIAMGNARLFEDKKKTESQLNEQTSAYRNILDSTFDAVVILDSEARIVEVNQMAVEMFRFSEPSVLLGKHIKELLNSYDPSFPDIEKMKTNSLKFPSRGTLPGGGTIELECRARIFSFLNHPHILLMIRDITDFIKAEIELKRSRNFSDTIADASPVVLWLTDESGKITYISNLWYKWIGEQETENLDIMELVDDAHREKAIKNFNETLKIKCALDIDVQLKRAAGSRWVNIHAEPNYIDEVFSGMAGSIMDITARKEAQLSLNKKNRKIKEELEDLVKERTADLEKTNYELLQFSSIASHDLKEPVRKISVFSRLLNEKMKSELTPDNSKYLQNIIHSAQRMTNLINDLLAFSRLSHVDESSFVNVNLNEVIELVIQDLELAISEKKATVTVDTMPEMKGIPLQLSQVFQNLISNSLKFSVPERPLVINISNQPEDEDHFRITYSDNGIGFNQTYREKIFEVFQRLHGREEYEGTGIGLSIVKKIVSLHKGYISAFGKEGEGATFEMLLPFDALKFSPRAGT